MTDNLQVKRGDTLPAVTVIARDAIGPVDLSGHTASFRMVSVLTGAVKVNNAAAAIAANPTFTADHNTNTLNSTAHGLVNGQDATLRSSGNLPGNLSAQRRYYAINVTTDTLQLADQVDDQGNGAAVDITSAGSGVHTLLIGKVTYDWQTADVAEASSYHGQIETLKDGRRLTYPNDDHLLIEIISDLTDGSDRAKAIRAVMDRVRPDVEPMLRQGEIELEVDRARLAREWQPDTTYKFNDVVVPVERNGLAYVCVQPGTSKSGAYGFYDWPFDTGYRFGDGNSNPGLVWECVGTDRFNSIPGLETSLYDIGLAARECWLKKARYASQFIDDGDLSFSQIRKHCLEHAAEFRPFRRQAVLVRV